MRFISFSILFLFGMVIAIKFLFGIPAADIHPHPSGEAVYIRNHSCTVNLTTHIKREDALERLQWCGMMLRME